MTNNLPLDVSEYVASAVASGRFDSPEAVVAAGVRLLQDRDEALRRELQTGIDALERGDYIEITTDEQMSKFFEGIQRRALKRLQADKANR